jgi:hypothetical protein
MTSAEIEHELFIIKCDVAASCGCALAVLASKYPDAWKRAYCVPTHRGQEIVDFKVWAQWQVYYNPNNSMRGSFNFASYIYKRVIGVAHNKIYFLPDNELIIDIFIEDCYYYDLPTQERIISEIKHLTRHIIPANVNVHMNVYAAWTLK